MLGSCTWYNKGVYFLSVLVFSFILGAIVGSFLNVLVLRWNTGVGLGGRSCCFSCGRKLSWLELVPILSFLFLRGKCSTCKSKISWQYPLGEFATGILFSLLAVKFSLSLHASPYTLFAFLISAFIGSILISITVYDIRHKIIPDGLVYTFVAASLMLLIAGQYPLFTFDMTFWLDLSAGPILALPLFAMWFFSSGRWIGLGDSKLVWGIGWFLGLFKGIAAFFLGFWIGAVFGLVLIALSRINIFPRRISNFGMKSEVPFAPFLILGAAVVFFTGMDIISISAFFQ